MRVHIKFDILMGKTCTYCENELPSKHIVITWTDSKDGFYSGYCTRLCLKNAMSKVVEY